MVLCVCPLVSRELYKCRVTTITKEALPIAIGRSLREAVKNASCALWFVVDIVTCTNKSW